MESGYKIVFEANGTVGKGTGPDPASLKNKENEE